MKKGVKSIILLGITFILLSSFFVASSHSPYVTHDAHVDGNDRGQVEFFGKGLSDHLVGKYNLGNNNFRDTSPGGYLSISHDLTPHGTLGNGEDRFEESFNTGTSTGATVFDGNSWLSIDDTIPGEPSGYQLSETLAELTISGWFYIDEDLNPATDDGMHSEQRLVSRSVEVDTGTGTDYAWEIVTKDGDIHFRGKYFDSDDTLSEGEPRDIKWSVNAGIVAADYENKWIFISATFQGDDVWGNKDHKAYLYVEKAEDETTNLRFAKKFGIVDHYADSLWNVGGGLALGSAHVTTIDDGPVSPFIGKMDDIRIYERALDVYEINALYREKNLDSSLILEVSLDGDEEDDYIDTSVNAFILNKNGAPRPEPVGRVNNGTRFSSTSGIKVNDPNNVLDTEQVTVAAWVKVDDRDGVDNFVTKRKCGSDVGSCNQIIGIYQWSLQKTASTHPELKGRYSWAVSIGGNVREIYGTLAKEGEWEFIVGTYDGETSSIYVNGIRAGSRWQGGPIVRTNTPVVIGARDANTGTGGGISSGMDGAVDEVKVFNRALNHAEVWELYSNTPLKYINFPAEIDGDLGETPDRFEPNTGYAFALPEPHGRTSLIDGNVYVTTTDGIDYSNQGNLHNHDSWPSDTLVTTGSYIPSIVVDHTPRLWVIDTNGITSIVNYDYSDNSWDVFPSTASSNSLIAIMSYSFNFDNFVWGPTWFEDVGGTAQHELVNWNELDRWIDPRPVSDLTQYNFPSDELPSAAFFYRITNCDNIGAVYDIDKDGNTIDVLLPLFSAVFILGGDFDIDDWRLVTDKYYGGRRSGTRILGGGCRDVDGSGFLDHVDRNLISGEYSITNYGSKNSEVQLWYDNVALGAKMYSANQGSHFMQINSDTSGLPLGEGAPNLGYYDDLLNKVIVWYGNSSYESSDGRNFKLFHGNGLGCSSDVECPGEEFYCSSANSLCVEHSCTLANEDQKCAFDPIPVVTCEDLDGDGDGPTETRRTKTEGGNCVLSADEGIGNSCDNDNPIVINNDVLCGLNLLCDDSSDSAECEVAVCGNGLQEGGEQCDGGSSCTDECLKIDSVLCGNNQLDPGETCDDGKHCIDYTECYGGGGIGSVCEGKFNNADPQNPILDEECKPRFIPFPHGDTCTESCTLYCNVEGACVPASCGNRVIEQIDAGPPILNEECDDGGRCNGDGAFCRHGRLGCAEGQGPCVAVSGDGCSNICELEDELPLCGDGLLTTGYEQCDLGSQCNDETAGDPICPQIPPLGIGTPEESCGDDGEICVPNFEPITCTVNCQIASFCGDGETDTPNANGFTEQCDAGANNGVDDNDNGIADICTDTCTLPSPELCGNGIGDEGEQCDDGNQVDDGNGCSADCQINGVAACGDNILQKRNAPNELPSIWEECDDGDLESGDGCTGDEAVNNVLPILECLCEDSVVGDGICESGPILLLSCGDGKIFLGGNPPIEQCDEGSWCNGGGDGTDGIECTLDANVCTGTCVPNFGRSGCSVTCQATTSTYCGDGIRQESNSFGFDEECDDGNNGINDGCSDICKKESGYYCTGSVGQLSVCNAIPSGLCGELNITTCEDSDEWTFEILQSIETIYEDFADANDLDFDFCTSPTDDNAKCGCAWTTPGVSTGDCVEYVTYDRDGDNNPVACYLKFGTNNLDDSCDGGETEYFILWTAHGDANYQAAAPENIGCIDGRDSFQCPSRVKLPFFTMINFMIALLTIYAIYFVLRRDFE